MKTILVPIDYTAESMKGLKTALDIACQVKGEITMLHNMDLASDPESDIPEEFNAVDQQSKIDDEELLIERLERLRGLRIQYHVPKMKMNFMVSQKLNPDKLSRIIQKNRVELIVLGKKQKHQSPTFLLEKLEIEGKKGEKHAIPVLGVKDYPSNLKYNKIFVNVDYNSTDIEFLKLVNQLADLLAMQVYINPFNTSSIKTDTGDSEKIQIDIDQKIKKKNFNMVGDFGESNNVNCVTKKVKELEVDLAATTTLDNYLLGKLEDLPVPQLEKASNELINDFI